MFFPLRDQLVNQRCHDPQKTKNISPSMQVAVKGVQS